MFAGLRGARLRPARLKRAEERRNDIRTETIVRILRRIPFSDCFTTPAAGYRHRETGVLAEVGSLGECWSSSTYASDAANASHLALASSKTCPVDTNGAHAYGFSVRCVQASAREVAFFLLYIRYGNLNAKNFSHRHSKPLDPLSERLWIPWKRGLRMRVRISFQEIDLMWQI